MCGWKQYWMAQLKRVGKALPGICVLTVLLSVCFLFLFRGLFLADDAKEEKKMVQIGIVGDLEDSYLGMGIHVIMNTEGIAQMVNILSLTKQEAEQGILQGEIVAYLEVPEGFLEAVCRGENIPLTYVSTKEMQGLGAVLVDEMVNLISQMVTTAQRAAFALQIYVLELHGQEYVSPTNKDINILHISTVLNHEDLYELQETGVSNSISGMGHLFSGVLLLLALLWGIQSVSLVVKEDFSMQKLLAVKGLGAGKQVLAEVSAYAVMQYFSFGILFLCMILLKETVGFSVREWDFLDLGQKGFFFIKMLPVIWMISTLQAFLYELADHMITGVLLQFVVAVSMAYVSGCIYPITFFPRGWQQVLEVLPVGVALRYLQGNLAGETCFLEGGLLLVYSVVLLSLHVLKRYRRITKV